MAIEGGLRWIVSLRGEHEVHPLQGNTEIEFGLWGVLQDRDVTQHVDRVG